MECPGGQLSQWDSEKVFWSLTEHAADRGHAIDWGSAKVVDSHQQFHQGCLLESWHIRSQDTTLNQEEGNLPPVYN